jgi:hypothetical protein
LPFSDQFKFQNEIAILRYRLHIWWKPHKHLKAYTKLFSITKPPPTNQDRRVPLNVIIVDQLLHRAGCASKVVRPRARHVRGRCRLPQLARKVQKIAKRNVFLKPGSVLQAKENVSTP